MPVLPLLQKSYLWTSELFFFFLVLPVMKVNILVDAKSNEKNTRHKRSVHLIRAPALVDVIN